MRILMIACSVRAWERLQKLQEIWHINYPAEEVICKVKCAALPEISIEKPLAEYVGDWFYQVDAILFCSAAGIAVRSIAPWIVHKRKDPAVLVMDEAGAFCIPILSGHWGGANELAERIAGLTGPIPVITTATDREQKFAVDVFARKNELVLTDWKLAKQISVQLLEEKEVGLYTMLPVEGQVPPELIQAEAAACPVQEDLQPTGAGALSFDNRPISPGIAISFYEKEKERFPETLQLIPRIVVAGIGCKKGTPEEKIAAAIERCFIEQGICPEALCGVASIDLKKEEQGLLSYCEKRGIPFQTFTAEQLRRAEGDFSGSAFVESVTGVDNVCERSAVSATDRLLCKKQVYDGITVALAVKKASVKF